jgi:hypothetical protein
MGEPEDKRDDPAGPESAENSERGVRNSKHPDLLKASVHRRKHGAYIDAMLERTTSDKAETGTERGAAADEKPGGSDP